MFFFCCANSNFSNFSAQYAGYWSVLLPASNLLPSNLRSGKLPASNLPTGNLLASNLPASNLCRPIIGHRRPVAGAAGTQGSPNRGSRVLYTTV